MSSWQSQCKDVFWCWLILLKPLDRRRFIAINFYSASDLDAAILCSRIPEATTAEAYRVLSSAALSPNASPSACVLRSGLNSSSPCAGGLSSVSLSGHRVSLGSPLSLPDALCAEDRKWPLERMNRLETSFALVVLTINIFGSFARHPVMTSQTGSVEYISEFGVSGCNDETACSERKYVCKHIFIRLHNRPLL